MRLSVLFFIANICWAAPQEQPVHVLRDPAIPSTIGHFTSASYSPDGARIVIASEYGIARVWNTKDYSLEATCMQNQAIHQEMHRQGVRKPNRPWIRDAEFGSDSERIVLAGEYGVVWIWNPSKGDCNKQELTYLIGHTEDARTAEFNKDSSLIVTTSDDVTVRVWTFTGRLIQTLSFTDGAPEQGFMTGASFSPDGKWIVATRSDGYVALIDTANYQVTPFRPATKDNQSTYRAMFSLGSDRILTTSENGEVAIWNLATKKAKVLRKAQFPGANTVAFSNDDKLVVVGTSIDKTHKSSILLYRADGDLIHTFPGTTESISKVSFSPDGANILASSYNGTAAIWKLPPNALPH
jgi:WD40 repeat protein